MGAISEIYEAVKSLLEQNEYYRDNDNALVCRIWTHELGGDDAIKRMTVHDFFVKYARREITSSESIYMAKRKVIENHPELAGKTKKRRSELEEEVKIEIKNIKN